MVAEMIVDIRDHHVEDDTAVKCLRGGFRLRAVLRERIDDFGIAAALEWGRPLSKRRKSNTAFPAI